MKSDNNYMDHSVMMCSKNVLVITIANQFFSILEGRNFVHLQEKAIIMSKIFEDNKNEGKSDLINIAIGPYKFDFSSLATVLMIKKEYRN